MEKEDVEFLEIARAIPVGSRNIERMRQEIHSTVMTVLGLVGTIDDHASQRACGYEWCAGRESVMRGLLVECHYITGVKLKSVYNSFYVGKGESSIPMNHVQGVYETLGYFIKLMCEVSPELHAKLFPLIRASVINHELFY